MNKKFYMQTPIERWEQEYALIKDEILKTEDDSDSSVNEHTCNAYHALIEYAKEYGYQRAPYRVINYCIETVNMHGSTSELEMMVIIAMREIHYVNSFIKLASNYVNEDS